MTDNTAPNEFAPATRSEWLALMREAVRLELEANLRRLVSPPQPPSEG